MTEEPGINVEEMERLANLSYRVLEHDAQQMEFRLNTVWSAYYALYRNYQDFTEAVAEYDRTNDRMYEDFWKGGRERLDIPRRYTPEEASESVLEKHELFVYLRELITKFNNYASSAYVLQENAQEFRKEWLTSELEKGYYEKLQESSLFGANKLIIDLRHYTTHVKSVPLEVAVTFDHEEDKREIRLALTVDKVEKRLNGGAKEYLAETELTGNKNNKIDIPQEVENHYRAASSFYDWLIEAMYDAYEEEFEELERLTEELRESQGRSE